MCDLGEIYTQYKIFSLAQAATSQPVYIVNPLYVTTFRKVLESFVLIKAS